MNHYRLRQDLLFRPQGSATSSDFVLEDPATARHFAISASEELLIRELFQGVRLADLDKRLAEFAHPVTALEYLNLYAVKYLLEPAPIDLHARVRKNFDDLLIDRLRTTIEYATTHLPYYRKTYARSNCSLAAIDTLAAFETTVPLLTRELYCDAFPNGLLPDGTTYSALASDPAYRVATSSGTTAERIQLIQPRAYLNRIYNSRYSETNLLASRHALFGPLGCMAVDCSRRFPSFDQRYFGDVLKLAAPNVLTQTPKEASSLLAELTTTSIDLLIANPFYLAYTCRQALRTHLRLPSVSKVLLSYDFAETTTRHYISQCLGVSCGDLFGMSEGGFQLMRSCSAGSVHMNEEFFYFELPPTEWGTSRRLIFTTHANRLTPLIRYQTSDLFELNPSHSRCPCGSTLQSIRHFDGRISHIVSSNGLNIPIGVIDRTIGSILGVVMYQLRTARDRIEFVYLDDGADANEVEKHVKRCLASLFGRSLPVTIRTEEYFRLNRSGKFDTVLHVE